MTDSIDFDTVSFGRSSYSNRNQVPVVGEKSHSESTLPVSGTSGNNKKRKMVNNNNNTDYNDGEEEEEEGADLFVSAAKEQSQTSMDASTTLEVDELLEGLSVDTVTDKYTIAEAMFLIARNSLPRDDAIKFVHLISKIDTSVWADITRCKYTGSIGDASIRDEVLECLPATWLSIGSSIVSEDGSHIVDYIGFLQAMFNRTSQMSFESSSGWYTHKSVRMMKISGYAYGFEEINIENISVAFKVHLESEYDYDGFRRALVFFCNGKFVIDDGMLRYRMHEYPHSDVEEHNRYTIPSVLWNARKSYLSDWFDRECKIKADSVNSSIVIKALAKWPYLEKWPALVSTAFKRQTRLEFSLETTQRFLKSLPIYSGSNKTIRSSLNKHMNDDFIRMPEFDYENVALNFLVKSKRKEWKNGCSSSLSADDDSLVYDWTGIKKENFAKTTYQAAKSIMIMLQSMDVIRHVLSFNVMFKISHEQRHSLNVILTPTTENHNQGTLLRRFSDAIYAIREGEYLYMANLIKGEFKFTGSKCYDYCNESAVDQDDLFSQLET
jgi:hypothetical protein